MPYNKETENLMRKLSPGDFFIFDLVGYNTTTIIIALENKKPLRINLGFCLDMHGERISHVTMFATGTYEDITVEDRQFIKKNIQPHLPMLRNPELKYFDLIFFANSTNHILTLTKLL